MIKSGKSILCISVIKVGEEDKQATFQMRLKLSNPRAFIYRIAKLRLSKYSLIDRVVPSMVDVVRGRMSYFYFLIPDDSIALTH